MLPIIKTGDCLTVIPQLDQEFCLAYLDPPFFTGGRQEATTRDGKNKYYYSDSWKTLEDYLRFIRERLIVVKNALHKNGSIIYHCDWRTSHHARVLLESIWGQECFKAEIVWTYKRWSNSKRGLMPAHQTLFWFAGSEDYIFNQIYNEYSPTTNVDQLLQLRTRDKRNKSVYATEADGGICPNGKKPGVPFSDVWDIPYLNPKAKERVGYPTQKPIALLSRVVKLFTNESDWVLDPFCGSGTTLVAANLLGRNAVGIDISPEAASLAEHRSENPVVSHSRVLEVGRDSYRREDNEWKKHLAGLCVTPVQRNRAIDAVLQEGHSGLPVLFRVQRPGESIGELRTRMLAAVKKKRARIGFIIETNRSTQSEIFCEESPLVQVVKTPAIEVARFLENLPPLLDQPQEKVTTGFGHKSSKPEFG